SPSDFRVRLGAATLPLSPLGLQTPDHRARPTCRLPGERDHFRAGFAMKMGPPVLPLMGPPGWRFASYGTTPAWLRGLPVVGPLYWPNELPGGVGDRDRGDAAAVAAG